MLSAFARHRLCLLLLYCVFCSPTDVLLELPSCIKKVHFNNMNLNAIKSSAQVRGFYDTPLYKNGDIKPDYYDLFNWSPWCGLGFAFTQELKNSASTSGGSLREDLFDTIKKKIAYLQGVFEDLSEGYGVIRGENWIQFANSNSKVERCKKWINEVARYMAEHKGISSVLTGGVIRHNIEYTGVPISHRVDIQTDVVKFIKNYQFTEEL